MKLKEDFECCWGKLFLWHKFLFQLVFYGLNFSMDGIFPLSNTTFCSTLRCSHVIFKLLKGFRRTLIVTATRSWVSFSFRSNLIIFVQILLLKLCCGKKYESFFPRYYLWKKCWNFLFGKIQKLFTFSIM